MALLAPSSSMHAPRTRTKEWNEASSQTSSDYQLGAEFAEWVGPQASRISPKPSADRFFFEARDRSLLPKPCSQQQQSSVKRLTASQSSVNAYDPLFYAKYSFSLPTSLRSSPRRDRSIPRFVPKKTEGWDMKIGEVAPEEKKNRRGREEKQRKPSFESAKPAGEGAETCASGKTTSQERRGLFTRARSLSSSCKIFHMMDGQPLQSYEVAENSFTIISVDSKEHGKCPSRQHTLGRSGGKTMKELWRMGDNEVRSRENFRRYPESSPLDERLSKFCAGRDVGSKGIETRNVSGAATEMTPRGSRSDRSMKSPKGPVSPHELHYTTHRAHAEQKRRRTFMTYMPSILSCTGFTSKGYRSAVGMQSLHACT